MTIEEDGPWMDFRVADSEPVSAGAVEAPAASSRLPKGMTESDFDHVVRTVYGEAAGEPELGQQAVAAVIANRARQSGRTHTDVVKAPWQFEPWMTRRRELESLDPTSDKYQRIAKSIFPILNGDVDDPTSGATHFYSPRVQRALGRAAPTWDNGSGVDLGNHRFFNLGYGGKGPHGIPQQMASAKPAPLPGRMALGGDAPAAEGDDEAGPDLWSTHLDPDNPDDERPEVEGDEIMPVAGGGLPAADGPWNDFKKAAPKGGAAADGPWNDFKKAAPKGGAAADGPWNDFKKVETKAETKEPDDGSWQIGKGFMAGLVGTNPKMVGDAMAGFGELLDMPGLITKGDEISKWGKERLDERKARVPSYKDIRTDSASNFLADLGSYAGYSTGQGVASSLPSIVTGGAAAMATSNPFVGLAVGAAGPSYIQNYGDVYGSAREDKDIAKLVEEGKLTKKQLAGITAMAAVPMAALDIVSLETMLGRSLAKEARDSLMKSIFKGIAVGAVTEGSTEGLQEIISQWAQHYLGSQTPFREKFDHVVDNVLGGAFTGASMGAGGAAANRVRNGAPKADAGEVSPTGPIPLLPGPTGGIEFPPEEKVSAAPPPASADETGWLRARGYSDEAIAQMGPDERAAEIEDAKAQGLKPVPVEKAPDTPSAEPVSDLVAQARDFADDKNERQGVYLPAPSLEVLKSDEKGAEQFVKALGDNHVVLNDFDGRGGALIVPNEELATAVQQAKQNGRDTQEIIGLLTGAGMGKPANGSVVVQQRDKAGNVTRETLTTPEGLAQAKKDLAAPGRTVVEVSPEEAIQRREQMIAGKPQGTRNAPVEIQSPEDVASAVAASSSDYTPAQGEAGNRKMGHATWNGLPISIETDQNNVRRGQDKNTGKEWSSRMGAPYGYFKGGVKSKDGMNVDVFMGPNPASPSVFVMDEMDSRTGKFRQHKTFVGFDNADAATQAYLGSSTKTEDMIGPIAEMSVDEFKDWLKNSDTSKPVEKTFKPEKARYEGPELSPDEVDLIVSNWKFVREADAAPKPQTLTQFVIAAGGLRDDAREVRHIMGAAKERPGLINKRGVTLDDMALAAWESGFFEQSERPTIAEFLDMLQDDLHTGAEVRPADQFAVESQRIAAELAEELSNDYGITTSRFRSEGSLREYLGQERPRSVGAPTRAEGQEAAEASEAVGAGRTAEGRQEPRDAQGIEPATRERDGGLRYPEDTYERRAEPAEVSNDTDEDRGSGRDGSGERGSGVDGARETGPSAIRTFDDFRRERDRLDAEMKVASDKLNAFPKGPMGLTDDAAKKSPEFRKAKADYDAAFNALRDLNRTHRKRFDKEAREERDASRSAAITTEKSGQTSLVPEATTKEKIAAEAKAKERRGGNEVMDVGMFGSEKDQTDLVDMAKTEKPSRLGKGLGDLMSKPGGQAQAVERMVSSETAAALLKGKEQARKYVLDRGKRAEKEFGAMVLPDGSMKPNKVSGTENFLRVDQETAPDLWTGPAKSVDFHHNHPRSTSFSRADYTEAAPRPALRRTWVHGHDGSEYWAELKGDAETLGSAYDMARTATELVSRKGLQMPRYRTHLIAEMMRDAGVIEYGAKLTPADADGRIAALKKEIGDAWGEAVALIKIANNLEGNDQDVLDRGTGSSGRQEGVGAAPDQTAAIGSETTRGRERSEDSAEDDRAEVVSRHPDAFNAQGHHPGQKVEVHDRFGQPRFMGTVVGPTAKGGVRVKKSDGKTISIANPDNVVDRGGASNASSGSERVERDRQGRRSEDRMGKEGVSASGEQVTDGARQGRDKANQASQPDRGGRVSARDAAPVGERGNRQVQDGEPGARGSTAGRGVSGRSGDAGVEGIPAGRIPAKEIGKASSNAAALKDAIAAQKKADKDVPFKANDPDNIRKSLPLLKPSQREDVVKAEARLSQPDKHGFLFTNGTGTGKTFTGLGVVKRFVKQGKNNVLIVAPSQGILDGWVQSGKMMGLDITRLPDTKSAGTGIVATTYANLRENKSLATRDWDLIVADESHKFAENKSGNPSDALQAFRAISNKDPHARAMIEFDAEHQALKKLEERAKADRSLNAEAAAARGAFFQKVRNRANELEQRGRAKALFLSATPFAYHKSTDYAEGFLFDYPETKNAYNNPGGQSEFLQRNFGYAIRYNRAEQPGSEVNVGVLEREFYERLRREGALSGRRLEVDADYDRRFVLVDDAVGGKIDQALDWLATESNGRYLPLAEKFRERFDHLATRRLLEAIKAKHAIPRIQKDIALGRKVVVFHDFNEGGGINPFSPPSRPNQEVRNWGQKPVTIGELYAEFVRANPYVKGLDFSQYKDPITTLKATFPDALIYNGTESNKARREARDLFNDDNSGRDLIIVQAQAGEAGISLHDTTGRHQRVLYNLGLPTRPTTAIQQEGRIYREGQASNAIIRYMSTGTSWERTAFARTIAERASTAENLALGEEARALRDSFIDAFNGADQIEQGSDEGIGGKARDRAVGGSVSPFERAKAFYFGEGKKRGRRDQREGADYYATPEPIGLKMAEFADIQTGDKVLEPSAGHGAIARWLPEGAERTLVEPSPVLASRAELAAPGAKMVRGRFEDLYIGNKYDAIVMNPPFGRGGREAFEHLQKAAGHLKDGGRIVAIVPRGPAADARLESFRSDKANKDLHTVAEIDLPGVMFERAGTSVATRMLVLQKGDAKTVPAPVLRDLSDAESIADLFDRIENLSLAPKKSGFEEETDAEDYPRVNKAGFELRLPFKSWGNPRFNPQDRAHALGRLREIQTMPVRTVPWSELVEARRDIQQITANLFYYAPDMKDADIVQHSDEVFWYVKDPHRTEKGPESERPNFFRDGGLPEDLTEFATQGKQAIDHMLSVRRAGLRELMQWGPDSGLSFVQPRQRNKPDPAKVGDKMRSGFYFMAGRKLSEAPDFLFNMNGQAVINWLMKNGVTREEINHFRLQEKFGQKPNEPRPPKVSRAEFQQAIAERMFDFRRKVSWLNPERSKKDYEMGGTRAFRGPRIPGRGIYFENLVAFPKKLKGGEAFAPGDFISPHWEEELKNAWASWRGSVREVPGWGKMVVGEEGQSDFMQGANSGRRPRISGAEWAAKKKDYVDYEKVMEKAEGLVLDVLNGLYGFAGFDTSKNETRSAVLNTLLPPRKGQEISDKEWRGAVNDLRKAVFEKYESIDSLHRDFRKAVALNEKLAQLEQLRTDNERYFAPGARRTYVYADLSDSYTPESPLDRRYTRTMIRDLLLHAAKENADSVAISTTETNDRIQINTFRSAGHFYDAQLAPSLERELRDLTGNHKLTLEKVALPKAQGAPRNEKAYTVWAAKLPPEVLADIRANGLRVMAVGSDLEEAGVPKRTDFKSAIPDIRRAMGSILKSGRPVSINGAVVTAIHKAVDEVRGMVPAGANVYALSRVEPTEEPGTVIAVFEDQHGNEYPLTESWNYLSGIRAAYFEGNIFLVRLSPRSLRDVGEFNSGVAAELGHEVAHALRWSGRLDGVTWDRLLAHAKALRLLDGEFGTYLKIVGDPSADKVADVTTREVYERLYNTRSNRAELMDQEEVAHLVEWYMRGLLSRAEVEPVMDILDDILAGRVQSAEREDSLEREMAFALAKTGREQRRDLDTLGYFSQALEAAKGLKQAKGTPEQMRAQLRSAGVKEAELQAVGLDGFLAGKTSVTKDEIVSFLRDNRVEVKEGTYGGLPGGKEWVEDENGRLVQKEFQSTPGVSGPAKWSSYSIDPSNPTYRETVIHLPAQGLIPFAEWQQYKRSFGEDIQDNAEGRAAYERYMKEEGFLSEKDFRSGHWSEPNVIAHARTSLQKTSDGKTVFLIDELQSDWGQKLRDGGVRDEAKIAELQKRIAASKEAAKGLGVHAINMLTDNRWNRDAAIQWLRKEDPSASERIRARDLRTADELEALTPEQVATIQDRGIAEAELDTLNAAAPGHPLVNTTDQWTTTAFRRLIRQAVEAGADYIALTPGKVQAERFNLARSVGSLRYDPEMKELQYTQIINRDGQADKYFSKFDNDGKAVEVKDLPGIIGKEMAERLLAQPRKYVSAQYSVAGPHTLDLSGENAQIGGSGMKATYDSIYPRTLGKMLAKVDPAAGKMTDMPLQSSVDGREFFEAPTAGKPNVANIEDMLVKFHTFPLTEAVKASVMEEGQPMFAIDAFHGSRHRIDQFQIDKIGTGEGAQAFGWGLYFAENELVAKHYRKAGTKNLPRVSTDTEVIVDKHGGNVEAALRDVVEQMRKEPMYRWEVASLDRGHVHYFATEQEARDFAAGEVDRQMRSQKVVTSVIGPRKEMNPFAGKRVTEDQSPHGNSIRYGVRLKSQHGDRFTQVLAHASRVVRPEWSELNRIREQLQDWDSYYHDDMQGNLYRVRINVEKNEALDWFVTLDKQPEVLAKIQDFVAKHAPKDGQRRWLLSSKQPEDDKTRVAKGLSSHFLRSMTGQSLYETIAIGMRAGRRDQKPTWQPSWKQNEAAKATSELLHSIGIKGIRFNDQMSRGAKREWLLDGAEAPDFGPIAKVTGAAGAALDMFDANPEAAAKWLDEQVSAPAPELMSPVYAEERPELVEIWRDAAALIRSGRLTPKPATQNIVIFNDRDVEITHKNGEPLTAKEKADYVEEMRQEQGASYPAFDDQGQMLFSSIPANVKADLSASISEAINIVNRIAGPTVSVRFQDTIGADGIVSEEQRAATEGAGFRSETLGGFYKPASLDAGAIIGLATNDPKFDLLTTAGHEAWHHVEEALASPAERRLITSAPEMRRMRAKAGEEIGLAVGDPRLDAIPEKEIRAIAFQKYRREKEEGLQPQGIHIGVRRFWDRVLKIFAVVRNAMGGHGLKTYEEVFERARTGEIARPAFTPSRRDYREGARRDRQFAQENGIVGEGDISWSNDGKRLLENGLTWGHIAQLAPHQFRAQPFEGETKGFFSRESAQRYLERAYRAWAGKAHLRAQNFAPQNPGYTPAVDAVLESQSLANDNTRGLMILKRPASTPVPASATMDEEFKELVRKALTDVPGTGSERTGVVGRAVGGEGGGIAEGRSEAPGDAAVGAEVARADRLARNARVYLQTIRRFLGDTFEPSAVERRAHAQGFAGEGFHGTRQGGAFEIPDPFRPGQDFGFHFAVNRPNAANARLGYPGATIATLLSKLAVGSVRARVFDGWAGSILPIRYKVSNPLRLPDVGNWADPAKWQTEIGNAKGEVREILNWISAWQNDPASAGQSFARAIAAELERRGYDGIIYRNRVEAAGVLEELGLVNNDSMLVWDMRRVRSANDMFDPRAANDAGLMASARYVAADVRSKLNDLLREEGMSTEPVESLLPTSTNRGSVGQNEGASAPSGVSGPLDMSPAARKARAEAMGFDTSKVWYHGTGAAFDEFKPSPHGSYGPGIYLTLDQDHAQHFVRTRRVKGGQPSVLELYVRGPIATWTDVPNPVVNQGWAKEMFGGGPNPAERAADWARENGFAGFTTGLDNKPARAVIFDPANIRSVDAAFDPAETDSAQLMASLIPRAIQQSVSRSINRLQPRLDRARVGLQDKFLPVRRIQEEKERQTGTRIPINLDTYVAEALFHGRAGEQTADLKTDFVEPLVDILRKADISKDQFDDYLYARHARERNDAIAMIDPSNTAGSGMTNQEADAILIAARSKQASYDAAAKLVDTMLEETRKRLLRAGLIDRETFDQWQSQYAHYVPLRGWESGSEDDAGRARTGRGFDIRGPEAMQALGRRSKADSPLGYALLQAQQAIVRAEKNRVDKTLYRFIQAYPDPALYRVYTGEARRRVNPSTGLIETYWVPPAFVRADNIHGVKIGGKQYYMELRDPQLARAMRGVQGEQHNAVLRGMMWLSRTYAQMLTSWNPEFVVSNFLRDIQTALMNVTDVADKPEGVRRQMVKDALSLKSIRGVMNALRGDGNTEFARWFEEYRQAGGKISFMEYNDVERIQTDINKSIERGRFMRVTRKAFEFINDLNTAVENGVRLSVYAAMRKAGISQDRAAFVARELTVNFNRKGEWSPVINSMYLFFNASVQGTTRMAQAIAKSRTLQVGVASIMGLAFMTDWWNYLVAGDDDDGKNRYDKIQNWIKERNLIVMTGRKDGSYLQIPMPYGYNLFWFGSQQTGAAIRGAVKPWEAAKNVAGAMLEVLSPIGGAQGSVAQMVAPTMVDPFVQVIENKTWYGGPIYPTKFNKKQPDSETYFSSAPSWAIDIARTLNRISGGNSARSGAIDISPEVLQHFFEFAGGGVAKFIGNVGNTATRAYNGQEWLPEKTPFVRRVYGKATTESRRSDFYKEWEEVDAAKYEVDNLIKNTRRGKAERDEIVAAREKYAVELQAYASMKATRDQLGAMRKQRTEIELNRALSSKDKEERLQEIQNRENQIILRSMGVLNRIRKDAKQAKEKPPALVE